MEKTIFVNLGGMAVNVTEAAFGVLQRYEEELKNHFSAANDKETIDDIEVRLAELLTERLQRDRREVVEQSDVEAAIETLGHPNQFDDDSNNDAQTEKSKNAYKYHRKFYRDPHNKILGGVCAGLAAYLKWDVTWVRLLTVLLACISLSWIVIVYIMVWIIAPQALTVAQQLEMHGKEANINNISAATNLYDTAQTPQSTVGQFFIKLFKILFAIIVGILLLTVAVTAIAIIMVIVYAIVVVCGGFGIGVVALSPMLTTLIVASLVYFAITIAFIVALCVRLLRHNRQSNTQRHIGLWITGIALWIISLIVSLIAFVHVLKTNDIEKFFKVNEWYDYTDNDVDTDTDGIFISEMRPCQPFAKIDVGSAVNVFFTPADSFHLEVQAPDEKALHVLHTEFQNNTLTIRQDTRHQWRKWGASKATVYLSAPTLEDIGLHSASLFTCNDTLRSQSLAIRLSGASKATLNAVRSQSLAIRLSGASKATLNAIIPNITTVLSGSSTANIGTSSHTVKATLSGASNLTLYGRATKLQVTASGDSNLDAKDLEAHSADIQTSGASDADVYVSDSTWFLATGMSNIRYSGTPVLVQSHASGGSHIECHE